MLSKVLPSRAYEWPTLCLLIVTYGLWAGITYYASSLGPILAIILLTPIITLHSSLQHETLHVLEPRWKFLGPLAVFPALGLAIPYFRFRDSHLEHHRNEILTDPYDDPESGYLVKEVWVTLPRWVQIILKFNNTLAGRLILGPLLGQIAFMHSDWRLIKGGDRAVMFGWLIHIPAVITVLWWVLYVASIPIWAYVIASYCGLSILKIRTFLEHRAFEQANGRSVIIEDRGIFAFLFLNNNFHAVHHAKPQVAWYNLPAYYQENKTRFLHENRDYKYKDYRTIFRSFFWHAKEPVAHPLWSLENRNDR